MIFLYKFVKSYCLVSYVRWALLVRLYAKSVATFDHICWTKSEAENRVLRGLSRTLSIAITINEFFFWVTLLNNIKTWLNTDTFVVYGTIRTHWCADVTFSHNKAWWTDREPLIITLLAVSTLFLLSIASP